MVPDEPSFLETLDKVRKMDISIVEEPQTIGEITEEIKKMSDRYDVIFFDHFNYILPDGYNEEDYAEALPDMQGLEDYKMLIDGKPLLKE